MIVTTCDRLRDWSFINPHFPEAFSALTMLAAQPFTPKHRQDGSDGCFYLELEYETHPKDGSLMEVHRKYIDVMWLISGQEQIAVCPVKQMVNLTQPYEEAGDAALGMLADGCSMIQMSPGSVCILFPEDAHAPGITADVPSTIQKLIAKVPVI